MESSFIFGIHEAGGERHMAEAGRKGWILFTEELGADPAVRTGQNYRAYSDQGFGVIARLNNGYFPNGTIPNSQQYAAFAQRCANFVAASAGCKIWIIGNEMNYRIERPPIAALRIVPEVPRPQNAPSATTTEAQKTGLLAGLRRFVESLTAQKAGNTGGSSTATPTPTIPPPPGDPYGRGLQERFNAIYQPLPVKDADSRVAAAATTDGFEVITPALYARCFKLCRDAIRSVPGHANDQVLIGAVAPWNNQTAHAGNERGDWVRYFQEILTALGPGGLDGITLHTYTHGADPNLISSEQRMNPPFTDRYFEFPAYRDFMNAIPAAMRSLPVYITETNQDVPWLNQNIAWIQRAYGEINWWNQQPNNQQIRALILYRWPVIDLWFIEGKGGVVDDFKQALQQEYRWRSSTPTTPPFAPNNIVATTTAVNIRRTAGYVGKTASDILVQTPTDARLTILSAAPEQRDGLDWWQVRYSPTGQTPVVGWVAHRSPAGAELLRLVSTGGGGTGTFKAGDSVRTTTIVRLRRSAGYIGKPTTDIIADLPANTNATVLGGPTNLDSLIWWQVRVNNSGQEGWVAERSAAGDAWLVLNTTPIEPPVTGKFKVGDRVVTVSAARLRQSPGYVNKPSTDVVADIAQGVEGQVLAGPRQADNLNWWQLETTNPQGVRVTGWMAETGPNGVEILRLSTGTTPPVSPSTLAPGDLVVATANVRVRATPGYLNKPDSDLRGDFLARATIYLLSGPQSVDGLAWWRVGGILSSGSEIVGWSAETAPAGARLIGWPAKLAGTQIPDKATGAYLALPFQGSFGISQLWGENPAIYSQFRYDNVPLRGHNGIDFLTPVGTPIVAVDNGTVAETIANDQTGFGQYVKVNHSWGEALYGHLSAMNVTPGQPVARGAVLGATGNTGFSFGPHLHFALRINPYSRADGWGGFADPLPYFDPAAVQLPAYVTASRTAARLEAPALQAPDGKVLRTVLTQKPGYAPDRPGVKRP